MNITPNVVLGICLVFVGVALGLDRLGVVPARELLQFWPLGIVLLGLSFVFQAFRKGDGTGRDSSMALGFLPLIVLCVITAHALDRGGSFTRVVSREAADVVAILGRDERAIAAGQYSGGQLTSVMGEAELDLRQATLAEGQEVVVDVFAVLGGAVIRVPESWAVDVQATPVMGHVRTRRSGAPPPSGAPRVVVRGLIMMGGLSIRS